MDHPVVALAADREQPVAAVEPLAVEADLDLALLPLVQFVGAAIPDPHRPGAVLPLGDVALEVEVFERVVLGVNRESVLLGVRRDAVGDRPRREHSVVLESQIPVQTRGVVLLNDEPRRVRFSTTRPGATRRLGGLLEVALALVRIELLGRHGSIDSAQNETYAPIPDATSASSRSGPSRAGTLTPPPADDPSRPRSRRR